MIKGNFGEDFPYNSLPFAVTKQPFGRWNLPKGYVCHTKSDVVVVVVAVVVVVVAVVVAAVVVVVVIVVVVVVVVAFALARKDLKWRNVVLCS